MSVDQTIPSPQSAPTAVKKQPQQPGIVEDLVDALLNGGVNRGLHVVTNACFVVLFIFLILLGAFWGLNIHVLFLLALCTGLMVSINWFVSVMLEVQDEEKQKAFREELERNLQNGISTEPAADESKKDL